MLALLRIGKRWRDDGGSMTKVVDGDVLSDSEGTHRLNIKTAEMTRQVTRGTTEASQLAADVAYFRTVIASAKANNSNAGLQPAVHALIDLTGSPV
jgi:hypothetical protein